MGVVAERCVGGAFRRRSDAISAEFLAAFVADPVGGPWRRKRGFDAHMRETSFIKRAADRLLDVKRRRAASVSRRDDDAILTHVANNAEIDDADGGNFWVGDGMQNLLDTVRIVIPGLATQKSGVQG